MCPRPFASSPQILQLQHRWGSPAFPLACAFCQKRFLAALVHATRRLAKQSRPSAGRRKENLRLHKLKDSAGLTVVANAIHDKIELLLKFLNNDDDEVSQGVIEFAREYLQFLKNKASAGVYTTSDSSNVEGSCPEMLKKKAAVLRPLEVQAVEASLDVTTLEVVQLLKLSLCFLCILPLQLYFPENFY
ncbi:hypothetical protein AVEN_185674-1 [Araneus ventricosus]|uniref:Uncharacterized protein n=1 Tax=Araneus ventricosus TaxID=182803 RepID=A0A4Y2JGY0_ARAVE|nr:hypothetical protein AVEN_185674-1 [Araneus ventricosus]